MAYRFTWVIPEKLAGMAIPGLLNDRTGDMVRLREHGITHIVTLTEHALDPGWDAEFRFHHYPIQDMGAPQHAQTESYCRLVDDALARGERVAVHCHAGIGRTGTLLAAYLIWRDALEASQALEQVRQCRAAYVQSPEQEAYLHAWAEHLKNQGAP